MALSTTKILMSLCFLTVANTGAANAQHAASDAVKPTDQAAVVKNFVAIRDSEGIIRLVEDETQTSAQHSQADDPTISADPEENPLSPWHHGIPQDWYLISGPEGMIEGVYGVTSGMQLPEEILSTLPVGGTVQKTDFAGVSTLIDWSWSRDSARDTVIETLQSMIDAAVGRVCSMQQRRPRQFSMNADVRVSLGLEGGITMGMVWDTAELCQ